MQINGNRRGISQPKAKTAAPVPTSDAHSPFKSRGTAEASLEIGRQQIRAGAPDTMSEKDQAVLAKARNTAKELEQKHQTKLLSKLDEHKQAMQTTQEEIRVVLTKLTGTTDSVDVKKEFKTQIQMMQRNIEMRDMLMDDMKENLGFKEFQSDMSALKGKLPPDMQKQLSHIRNTIHDNFVTLNALQSGSQPKDILNALLKGNPPSETLIKDIQAFQKNLAAYPDIEDPVSAFLSKISEGDYNKNTVAVTLGKLQETTAKLSETKELRKLQSTLASVVRNFDKTSASLSPENRVAVMVTPEYQLAQEMVADAAKAKEFTTFSTVCRMTTKSLSIRLGRIARAVTQNFSGTGPLSTLKGIAKTSFQALKQVGMGLAKLVGGMAKNVYSAAKDLAKVPGEYLGVAKDIGSVFGNRVMRLFNSDIPKKEINWGDIGKRLLDTTKKLGNAVWTLGSTAMVIVGAATPPLGSIVGLAGMAFLGASGALGIGHTGAAVNSKMTANSLSKKLTQTAPQLNKTIDKHAAMLKTVNTLIKPLEEKLSAGSISQTELHELSQYKEKLETVRTQLSALVNKEIRERSEEINAFLKNSSDTLTHGMEAMQNAAEFVNWGLSISAAGAMAAGQSTSVKETVLANFDVASPTLSVSIGPDTITNAFGKGLAEQIIYTTNMGTQHALFALQGDIISKVGDMEKKVASETKEDKTAGKTMFRAVRQEGVENRLGLMGMRARIESLQKNLDSAIVACDTMLQSATKEGPGEAVP